jgi:REP element-mobilizing transposase RayT
MAMNDRLPSAFDWSLAQVEHRDHLPHIRQENVIYFVTFRLADSLPQERIAELRDERDRWLAVHPPPHSDEEAREYRSIWTVRIENLMDAGYGGCVLRDATCRGFLEATMRHDDGRKYELGEFVIMPNHVHALVHALTGNALSDVIKAWKSISARCINKQLGRRGSLWRDEYFDHAVRQTQSLDKFVRYIRENPRNLEEGEFTVERGTLRC